MIDHLVWSTATAVIAFGVAWLLRHRSASLRFTILFLALMRFAIPTPWLMSIGSSLAGQIPTKAVAHFADDVSQYMRGPGNVTVKQAPAPLSEKSPSPTRFIALVWGVGTGVILAFYFRRVRIAMPAVRDATLLEREALWRASDRLNMRQRADLRIVDCDFAPGALGISHPQVVLSDGLSDHLTDDELQSVLAHELAHIDRRDNLTAFLARAVAAAFWFHPLVLLLLRQLLIERETACDEFVLAHGLERDHYLTGIAKVCELAVFPSHAYAGITGSNLKHRLEHIMTLNHRMTTSSYMRGLPATLAAIAILVPATGGFLRAQQTNVADRIRQLVIAVESDMGASKPDAAIARMQQELAKDPTDKDVRLMAANIYVRTERYGDAIAVYKTLILENPKESGLHFKLGETYRRQGQLDKSKEEFQLASDLAAGDIAPLQQLALLEDGTGHRAEARALYEKMLEIDPNQGVALNNLAYIRAEDNPAEALALAQHAAAVMPKSADVADTLGWVYLKNHQPEQAVMSLRDALRMHFDQASVQSHFKAALDEVSNPTPEMKELTILIRADVTAARDARIQELLAKLGR